MSVAELIERWHQRQLEILNTLTPELLAEYNQLEGHIAAVQDAAQLIARLPSPQPTQSLQQISPIPTQSLQKISPIPTQPLRVVPLTLRIPLIVHKQKLIEYLAEHGPSTRREITTATMIPPGSLSELLKGEEFEQHVRGFWALKGQVKTPGTSAPPTK